MAKAQVPIIAGDGSVTWQQYGYNELLDALRRDLQLDPTTDIQQATATSAFMNPLYVDGAAGVASMRTLGTGPQQAPAGDTVLLKTNNLNDVANSVTALNNLGIAFGRNTFTWPGAVPQPPDLTITTGLTMVVATSKVYATVGGMSDGQGAAAVVAARVNSTTQIVLGARISGNYYNPAAGVTAVVNWLVIV